MLHMLYCQYKRPHAGILLFLYAIVVTHTNMLSYPSNAALIKKMLQVLASHLGVLIPEVTLLQLAGDEGLL